MFFVNDSQKQRHKRIRSFLSNEPMIAVLLGAADFEWTYRRAVIGLGQSPNVDIREVLRDCRGLDDYKETWKREVQPSHSMTLSNVVPNWEFFKKRAFPLRHKIIHGVIGTVGVDYAGERVESMLAASQAIAQFSLHRDCDIYKRLKVRRRKKSPE